MKRNYIKPVMALYTICVDTEMMAGSPLDIGMDGDKDDTWDAEVKASDIFDDVFSEGTIEAM
ncbi:MAG: hypothetical protein MJY59_01565 [Bacteroidaceae bacterium]|nr:hypothetical protein [Bacteroidaceae bacterium]